MGAAFNISLKIVFLFEMPKKASKDLRTTDSSEYSLTVKESIFYFFTTFLSLNSWSLKTWLKALFKKWGISLNFKSYLDQGYVTNLFVTAHIIIGGPDKIVLVFLILLPLNKFLQGSSSTYFKNLSFYPVLLKLKYLSLFQNSAPAGKF